MPTKRRPSPVPGSATRVPRICLTVARQALQTHRRVIAALHQIAALALSEQPLPALLHAAVAEVSAATGFPIVAIEFYDPANQCMEFAAATGIPLAAEQPQLRVPVDQTLSGLVARSGQFIIENHAQERAEYAAVGLRQRDVQTVVCVPLIITNRIIGTLSLAHPDAVPLDVDLVPLAQSLADGVATLVARHRAGAELQVALTKYRTLFDSFPLGITVSDDTGQIVETNAMAERLLGLGPEEQRQRMIDGVEWQIVRLDGSPMPSAEFASVRALTEQHVVENMEMGVRMPGGAITWLNVTAAPLPLAGYGVVVTYGDTSAHLQAEAALRESERSLQQFLDNSPDTIYVLDLGTYTSHFLNRETFLGYSRRELERKGSIRAAIHPDDYALVAQWRQLATMSEQQLASISYRAQNRQGDWEWLHQRMTVLSRTEQGTPQKLLITLSIITEQRQAEALVATQRDLARLIATTTDPAVAWPRCLELAVRVCGMDCGGMYLFDADAQMLALVAHQGVTARFAQATARYPLGTPSAEVLIAGEAVYLAAADVQQRAVFQLEPLRCIAFMPILAQGQMLGCVSLGSHTLSEVPAFARHALEIIATEIGNVVATLRTAAALREREELYHSLLESLDSVVVIIDTAGRFLYLNEVAAALFGGSPQQVVGRTMGELFPAPVAQEQLAVVQQVIHSDQGAVTVAQTVVQGLPRWYRTSIQPLHDDQGRVSCALVHATDIHDLKTAQQELIALNQTLEARVAQRTAEVQDLYDHAPVGYHSLDGDGHVVHVNQTELDCLGYTRAELLGRPLSDLMTPASRASVPARFAQILAQGWLQDFEVEMVRKDGSTFPALINATAIYDAAGAFVMTRSTLTDLTLRKQAEAALREGEQQLRLSEARLQLLLAKTPAVIFSSLAEDDFHSTFISDSVRAVLGYEPAQFLSGPGFWASNIHPDDKARVFSDGAQLFAQGWRQYEYRCRHADGRYRWVESGVSLLPAVAGRPAEVVGYIIDITPRKQAEALLQHANAELARAAQAKDEFLANMSHELRTPLNAILGFSESLQDGIYAPLTAAQQGAVQHIETSGRHLLALINDILDLSKGEAGKLTLEVERIDIVAVCQASLVFVKELALKKRLRLDVQLADPHAVIEADPRRLKQMLVNLLSNAVKFTPADGQVILAVAVDAADGLVRFRVEDTGIGIAPEDQGRLFQPFSQIDSALSRQQAGSGLGLALVRRLAELHGGEAHVESAVGVGSRFTITLPLRQPALGASAPARESSSESRRTSGAASSPHVRVLLTDDQADNLRLVGEYLQAHGYEVAAAHSGHEALAQVAQVNPAVILMDIQMPDLDGLEVIRRLRAQAAWATTPIIALTALAMPGDRERCLAAGASAYLTKPVRLQELVTTIQRLLTA
jgi:PAS domain S-box-containing protein